jgi:hypothetical protein
MNPIHSGKVEKGKLILNNPNRYLVHLVGFEGKDVELVLRKKKSQRSLNQNAWYFGVIIEVLREHLGYDKDEIHEALKNKFASKTDERTGLVIVESTARMDTKRFGEYCEQIQRWAAEFLQVYIPDPNQVDYEEYTR